VTQPELPAPEIRDAAILIVDDEEANVRLLARILGRAGYTHVHTTSDPREVLPLFHRNSPDLIVLDVRMPGMDGFAVLAQLNAVIPPTDFLPVLAITGDASPETRQRVLRAGAKDFLEKPFEGAEVTVRVHNLLTTRMLHRSLQRQNDILEQKVRERTAELETALASAQAASLAKSQFLATMSHELRTPLNAVIGFSQHLRKNKAKNLVPQDLTFLERIGENGMHLLKIINDILDLSRIEAGKMPVERTGVALNRLVSEIIEQAAPVNEQGTEVVAKASVPSNLQLLYSDESKLRRVLINLVGNAAKFTESGYLRIGVLADALGRPIRIDVIDTGIGIPAERLGAIFERFEQVDNSTQRRFGGTGLGLAISRTLCELLGYKLAVVSDMGVGSAFSVLLDSSAKAPVCYAELAATYDDLVAVAS